MYRAHNSRVYPEPLSRLNRLIARKHSDSKTYPTQCPSCGEAVFYYEKKHPSGRVSKVFFQRLGKPWERHDCRERFRGRHRHK